jgi:hypothetical protein
MNAITFEAVLDRAIDAVRRGRPMAEVLAEHPRHAAMLQPLLEAAAAVRDARPTPPRSHRLVHDYDVLQAAVERARLAAERPVARPVPPPSAAGIRGRWWRTRLAYFMFLFTLAGGGATVVAGAGLHDRVADFVIPGSGATHHQAAAPQEAPFEVSEPAEPAPAVQATSMSAAGAVSDLNGATFTLRNGDSAWRVILDGDVAISGTLADGAAAVVSGWALNDGVIHATQVSAMLIVPEAAAAVLAHRLGRNPRWRRRSPRNRRARRRSPSQPRRRGRGRGSPHQGWATRPTRQRRNASVRDGGVALAGWWR